MALALNAVDWLAGDADLIAIRAKNIEDPALDVPQSLTSARDDALSAAEEGDEAGVNEAIEPLRRDKVIRSSNEAVVTVPASAVPEGVTDEQLAELFITGTVTRGQSDEVTVAKSSDAKCGRCWRLLPDVPEDGALCGRCDSVVEGMDAE